MAATDETFTEVSANTTVDVRFRMGGHVKAMTPATGTTFTAFAAQEAKRVVIVNTSGDVIEVQQDGAGEVFPIPDGQFAEFYGISNTSQLAVRKKTAAAVDVYARWEA